MILIKFILIYIFWRKAIDMIYLWLSSSCNCSPLLQVLFWVTAPPVVCQPSWLFTHVCEVTQVSPNISVVQRLISGSTRHLQNSLSLGVWGVGTPAPSLASPYVCCNIFIYVHTHTHKHKKYTPKIIALTLRLAILNLAFNKGCQFNYLHFKLMLKKMQSIMSGHEQHG